MRRRDLLLAPLTMVGAPANAYENCQWSMQGRMCEVGVSLPEMIETYQSQQASQWCWAASIAMIFRHYDYDVSQTTIVRTLYGTLTNLPAFTTAQIAQLLSRDWTDDNGRRFRCRVRAAYDVFFGITGITNSYIVRELRAERPLLYCNRSHAMVLTAVAFIQTPMGPQIVNVGFADPYPGMGIRGPRGGEAYPAHAGGEMTFLASPSVTNLDEE